MHAVKVAMTPHEEKLTDEQFDWLTEGLDSDEPEDRIEDV